MSTPRHERAPGAATSETPYSDSPSVSGGQGLSIDAIVRRLNDDPSIPLPPRCNNQEWTRTAVKGTLTNTRYRSLWRYGVTEAVYVPEADYVRSAVRATPLREIQIEELRIVSDELWFKVQSLIAKDPRGRGPSASSRP